jgi:hypothetical protein
VPADVQAIRRLQKAAFFATAVLALASAVVLVHTGITLGSQSGRTGTTVDSTVSDACRAGADVLAGAREPTSTATTGAAQVEYDSLRAQVEPDGC